MPANGIGTSAGGLLAGGMVYSGTVTAGENLTGLDFGNVLLGDADGSGLVDVADYQVWFNNYGASMAGVPAGGATAAPEPASLALLALGSLAILRRRK